MHGLLRYFSRMCTRCTPFGMFAGISVGEMADDTEMAMSPEKTNKLHVRLDMNYICALAKDIAEIHSIKNKILFYPNDSIYKIGDKTRYVEYGFVKARRSHHISAVDATDYLQKVLDESRQGKRLDDLAGLLVDDEVTFDDARDFIDEMVLDICQGDYSGIDTLFPTGNQLIFRCYQYNEGTKEVEYMSVEKKDLESMIEQSR